VDLQITLWVNDLRRDTTPWQKGRTPDEVIELIRRRVEAMTRRMLSHDGLEAMISAVRVKETR
jgi:hypothetical protein